MGNLKILHVKFAYNMEHFQFFHHFDGSIYLNLSFLVILYTITPVLCFHFQVESLMRRGHSP